MEPALFKTNFDRKNMKPLLVISVLGIITLAWACQKMPDVPAGSNKIVIGTTTIHLVLSTSATVSTTLNNTGGNAIMQHGHCWSTSAHPVLTNAHSSLGPVLSTGAFTSELTNLNESTTYFIRPYFTFNGITIYGDQTTLTTGTLALPSVSTSIVIEVTSSSIWCGGNVTNSGNGTVSERGVCLSSSHNPTVQNSQHTHDGSGTGEYTSYLDGLTGGTTYYLRAYATNEKGTAYGDELPSTTLMGCGQLTVTYEGQTYHTVQVGDQCWFKENLNVGEKVVGTHEQSDDGKIEKYCYDNLSINCSTYGGLYQWDEMMQYSTTPGVQGICPAGWHIPTDDEWKIMEGTIDGVYGVGSSMWDQSGFRGSDAGKKLKFTSGWYNNGNGTDANGFAALSGGYRHTDGTFVAMTNYTYFWQSTVSGTTTSWGRTLYFGEDRIGRGSYGKTYGFSVRCVQN